MNNLKLIVLSNFSEVGKKVDNHLQKIYGTNKSFIIPVDEVRFNNGEGLEGHSFGNLFITALCAITGDMVTAVRASSRVLSIRGRVLPATLESLGEQI